MALTNAYIDLVSVKLHLDQNPLDTSLDQLLTDRINDASRAIDRHCRRRFWTTASDETRTYRAIQPDVFFLPDEAISVTTLQTDNDGDRIFETTWDPTLDYFLLPLNVALDGRPALRIEVDPVRGRYAFPRGWPGVQLTGRFGYCTTGNHPGDVREACLDIVLAWYLSLGRDPALTERKIGDFIERFGTRTSDQIALTVRSVELLAPFKKVIFA